MVNSSKVKEIMYSLGADLCGIASKDRFGDAPDTLETEDMEISFGQFIYWCLHGGIL